MRHQIENKSIKTMEEWNREGRYVKKGEKKTSTTFEGVATFTKKQTKKKKPIEHYYMKLSDECWADIGDIY